MGTFTILSKRSNNSYSFKDSTDEHRTVTGTSDMAEQEKTILSDNGNISYDGEQIANFSTSMYNGVLQYQIYGVTSENIEKAYTALAGVQYELKHLSEGTIESTPEGTGADVTLEN